MHAITLPALLATLVLTAPAHAFTVDELKDEVIERCRADMGEHGASMVKACVDMDFEAIAALAEYPETTDAIQQRCIGKMRQHGWSMVKACVDMDIEAEQALSNY